MVLMFLIIYTLLCTVAVYLIPNKRAKKWVKIISVWFSVPVALILPLFIGSYVSRLGNCQRIFRESMECIVYGFDVTNWMGMSVTLGYAIAFYALPWFVIGAICVPIYAAISSYKNFTQQPYVPDNREQK